jgi:hypothetical protein
MQRTTNEIGKLGRSILELKQGWKIFEFRLAGGD